MSEPKIISPMLDGFHMGAPISDHDGVRCYPAMQENSDNKYIVKVISIPASQVQLDALLLTGAYDDPGAAMDYFQELADGVAAEAKILKKLSKLEGFLAYDSWQVVPMDDNQLGYEVYLVSSYKRSLEKFLRRNAMTHQGAINMGLDLCSALAITRRAGYLYADLKPTNIFISDDKQYRIGDLGFLDMRSLKYTSLPRKYVSEYTAPELKDALTTVNTTVDTYAVGMILYQLYNNGQIPAIVEDEPLAAPANADYELAEIILKACATDPRDRFADPMEMGRELVAYMQRNRVTNDPITPPVAEELTQESPVEQVDETVPSEEDAQDVTAEEITTKTAAMLEQVEELVVPEAEEPTEETPEEAISAAEDVAPVEENNETPAETSMDEDCLSMMQPEETKEEPAMPVLETKKETKQPKKKKKKKKKGSGIKALILLLILALLLGGGFIFYSEYYLQPIHSISVDGSGTEMTVILDTEADNNLLTVFITDTYGNTQQAQVRNNQAHFENLLSDNLYKIRVEVSGFHKLSGVSSHGYTTPAETSIASLTAKTGPEDGSVVLSFAVSGPDTEEWTVTATAEGEETISQTFSSHTATVTGLTVGKTYTFTLEPVAQLHLVGNHSIEFAASAIVVAQNLKVSDYGNGTLTVTWNAPEGTSVDSWAVHCYSSDGVDKTLTTVETTATFGEIDTGREYTIEVLAAGMTEPARTSVSPDPAKLSNIQVNTDDATKLVITWDYEGEISEKGWHVLYRVDGSANQGIVEAKETTAVITPRIPGATYDITIVPANGTSAFDNTKSFECPNAEIFSYMGAGVSTGAITNRLQVNMLKTPENENWTYRDILKSDYTTSFAPGDKVSLLLYLGQSFYTYHSDITIMYVIRNDQGDVMTDYVSQVVSDWSDMWDGSDYRYCELDLPKVPTEAGNYSLYIYFNNQAIATVSFEIIP